MTKFEAKYLELHRAVSRLTSRMDEIHASEEYRQLYSLAAAHNHPYQGGSYEEELSTVTRLLATDKGAKKKGG